MTTDASAGEIARLYNVEQVMARLGVGRSMVFELIASGELRSVKVKRRRLVSEQALRDFVAQIDQQAALS